MSHMKNKMLGTAVKAAGTPAPPRMSQRQMDEERRYKAQDALRTITQAEQFKRDKGLMKDVKALAAASMKAVCGPGKK